MAVPRTIKCCLAILSLLLYSTFKIMMSLGVRLHVLTDSIATLITEMWAVMNKTWRMLAIFPSLEHQMLL